MKLSRDIVLTLIISWFLISFILGQTLLSNIGIGALIIYWFFDFEALGRVRVLIRSKLFWSLSVLFWLTLIGLLYTDLDSQSDGWKYVERRLGLLIFPLIFGTIKLPTLTFKRIENILLYSLPIVFLIGSINSYLDYLKTNDVVYFFNNNLLTLFDHQAVYFGIYINVVLLFVINKILTSKDNSSNGMNIILLATGLIFQYFLASRLSLVISLFLILTTVVFALNKKYGKKSIALIIVIFTAALVAGMQLSNNTIDRFKSLRSFEYDITSLEEEYNLNDGEKPANWNGLTIRLAIWKCASQLILDNPIIGVGTGDYKKELYHYYKINGFQYGINKSYTTHNQYIYLLVTSGLFGLVLFLAGVIYILRHSWANNNYLLVAILIIFLISFFTENVLNRNFGIILYSFILSTFVNTGSKK